MKIRFPRQAFRLVWPKERAWYCFQTGVRSASIPKPYAEQIALKFSRGREAVARLGNKTCTNENGRKNDDRMRTRGDVDDKSISLIFFGFDEKEKRRPNIRRSGFKNFLLPKLASRWRNTVRNDTVFQNDGFIAFVFVKS